MVITQVIGGLGNQMFQYAVGRSLALRDNTTVRLDISGFENYGLHQGFELQLVFTCPIEIASATDVQDILGWQSSRIIRRLLQRLNWSILCLQGLIVEHHFNYWSGLSRAPRNSYLVAYWQSEKYFLDIASTIRADFTFRLPLDIRNRELA